MHRSGDTNNFRFGKNLVRVLSGNIRIVIQTKQGFGKLCGADQLRTLRVYHERGRFIYGAASKVLGSYLHPLRVQTFPFSQRILFRRVSLQGVALSASGLEA
jgi:hypothetical protein